MTGQWFYPGSPFSSTSKTDRHDIAKILFESGVKHYKPTLTPLAARFWRCTDCAIDQSETLTDAT